MWAGLEAIDYFLKKNNKVFSIGTYMTKVFDLTLHSKMFLKMYEAKLQPIYLRLIIFKRKVGCWIGDTYVGIIGYSDDNWALTPSIPALQQMIDTMARVCS